MSVKDSLTQARALIDSALTELGGGVAPSVPTITKVPQGGNLQAAVDAAAPGDTILVYPDTYPQLTLRAKPQGTAPITIAPDTTALVAGQRIDPSFAPALIKLKSLDGAAGLRTDKQAANYILRGFAPLFFFEGAALAAIGDDAATDVTQQPSNIVCDQFLLLGDVAKGGRRGMAVNCGAFALLNSYAAGLFYTDDAQAVMGWNGPGSFLIANNYLEASGENIIFGGADAKNSALAPHNLIVRGNYLTKPIAWRGVAGHTVKSAFELKCMFTALIEHNVFEHSWTSGQVGHLVAFTPRNQNGSAPFTGVSNIVFQSNVMRDAAAGFQMLGTDNNHPSLQLTKIKILNNLIYGIDPKVWTGSGKLIAMSGGADDVEFGHNTFIGQNHNSFLSFDGTPQNALNVHDNIFTEGNYGIAGSNQAPGVAAWNAYVTNGIFERNVIRIGTSGRSITYPGNTSVKTGAAVVGDDFKPTAAGTMTGSDGTLVGVDVDALRKVVTF